MTKRANIDWRRWVAMLCIALTAAFALDLAEAAVPCDNGACSEACNVLGCDDQDENGAPCPQHHCCHGAAVAEPNAGAAIIMIRARDTQPSLRAGHLVSNKPSGLDRPPRHATAL